MEEQALRSCVVASRQFSWSKKHEPPHSPEHPPASPGYPLPPAPCGRRHVDVRSSPAMIEPPLNPRHTCPLLRPCRMRGVELPPALFDAASSLMPAMGAPTWFGRAPLHA